MGRAINYTYEWLIPLEHWQNANTYPFPRCPHSLPYICCCHSLKGVTGSIGITGTTGITGATGSNATATSGYAANTSGASIVVVLGGTTVALPNAQDLSPDITVNGANTVFTLTSAGRYYLSFAVHLTASLALGARLVVNGSPLTQMTIAPSLSLSSFIADCIVTLPANTTISLELFGLLGTAILVTGAGAVLTMIKLA